MIIRRSVSQLTYSKDPPRGKEEWIPADPRFQHGIDLVSYIRSSPKYSSQFCLGVAGQWYFDLSTPLSLSNIVTAYPEGHPDSQEDEDTQLEHLAQKVKAGADFIMTQIFYDVDAFLRWVRKCREKGTGGFHIEYPR